MMNKLRYFDKASKKLFWADEARRWRFSFRVCPVLGIYLFDKKNLTRSHMLINTARKTPEI